MTLSRPEDNLGGNAGYVTFDSFSAAGTFLAREKHYYYGQATNSFNVCEVSFPEYSPWQEGREYQTEALAAGGATVLRRVAQTWQNASNLYRADNPRIIDTNTTLIDTNQVSRTSAINPQTGAIGFDQFNNQTDTWGI